MAIRNLQAGSLLRSLASSMEPHNCLPPVQGERCIFDLAKRFQQDARRSYQSGQEEQKRTSTLLVKCPDAKGIAAALSQLLYSLDCSILRSDHFTDMSSWMFYQRLCFKLPSTLEMNVLETNVREVAQKWNMDCQLRHESYSPKVAVLVSKLDHCLYDLLIRHKQGELNCQMAVVMSNHAELEHVARSFGVDFICIARPELPAEARKQHMEQVLEQVLQDRGIELIVLARYMQILSEEFCSRHASHTINIHHSFLPAFVGAKPYHKAFERGVKVIGATAHYATAQLDAGPIIEQGIAKISHNDTVKDLIREGRDLERIVLARAVRWHLENRVITHANKTVVFA